MCVTKIGKKGIPMAIVGVNKNKDNIDLMPMGWLNERGCEIEWGEQVSITTPIPHQRRLILGCWQGLPYLDVNQIDIHLMIYQRRSIREDRGLPPQPEFKLHVQFLVRAHAQYQCSQKLRF